jgi:hypothetical protein
VAGIVAVAQDRCWPLLDRPRSSNFRSLSGVQPTWMELRHRPTATLMTHLGHGRSKLLALQDRLFDHLGSTQVERGREGEIQHLGGGEVDDEVELCRLQHRQVGGFLALEDAADVKASLAI